MKCYEIELNGETIRLRLRSVDICELEKKNNKSIIQLMKEVSQTNIVMFLMYMSRHEYQNYSNKEANELYDKLIDNDYTMTSIIFDIIYETLVVSGVMTKGELTRLKEVMGVTQEKVDKKLQEISEK